MTNWATNWISTALDEGGHFHRAYLESRNWTVVPVESAMHFDERDAAAISHAANSMGVRNLTAILLEQLKYVDDHRAVEATKDGLLGFSQEFSHFNVALLPNDLTFAVVCSTDDYFLVAGPHSFIEIATGMTVNEAYATFEEYASDDTWSASVSSFLVGILDRYRVV